MPLSHPGIVQTSGAGTEHTLGPALVSPHHQELSGEHVSVTLTGLLCGSLGNAVISSAENAGDHQHGRGGVSEAVSFSTFISLP